MTHRDNHDITTRFKLAVPRRASKALQSRANVGLPPEVAEHIDRFLETPAARKLGMKSRTDFVVKLSIAFLVNYDKQVEALERLYQLDTNNVKSAAEGDLD